MDKSRNKNAIAKRQAILDDTNQRLDELHKERETIKGKDSYYDSLSKNGDELNNILNCFKEVKNPDDIYQIHVYGFLQKYKKTEKDINHFVESMQEVSKKYGIQDKRCKIGSMPY